MNEKTLTFQEHLHELRRRLLWVVGAAGISGILGYVFRKPLIVLLQRPLNAPLFYSSPAGSFNFILKVSTIIGVFVALPVAVYHIIRFIEPALPKRIKNSTIAKLILASTSLALLGAAFGFFMMIPTSLKFFASYSTLQIKPLISADAYLNFVLNTLITFAVIFQIPLFVLFYNHIKPTKPRQLLRYQKHVVVGAFVLAVLLPFTYDPISQFVMAVPIIFLYYLSVALLWVANRSRPPKTTLQTVQSQPATHLPVAATVPEQVRVHRPMLVPQTARSIDGFVQGKPLRPLQTQEQERHSPLVQQSVNPPLFKKPRLSIDGISPRPHAV